MTKEPNPGVNIEATAGVLMTAGEAVQAAGD